MELEQTGGGDLAQTRCELYLAARRGGYAGSLEEIGGLVEWENLEDIEETLKSLWPPLARRRAEAMKQIKMAQLGIVETENRQQTTDNIPTANGEQADAGDSSGS